MHSENLPGNGWAAFQPTWFCSGNRIKLFCQSTALYAIHSRFCVQYIQRSQQGTRNNEICAVPDMCNIQSWLQMDRNSAGQISTQWIWMDWLYWSQSLDYRFYQWSLYFWWHGNFLLSEDNSAVGWIALILTWVVDWGGEREPVVQGKNFFFSQESSSRKEIYIMYVQPKASLWIHMEF